MRKKGEKIPEELWDEATSLAKEIGINSIRNLESPEFSSRQFMNVHGLASRRRSDARIVPFGVH